jgi:excisionase family DNA binding protein
MIYMDDSEITLNPKSTPASIGVGFATVVEAAHFLHLSKAMVHKLVASGTMPACRYGKAVRIPWKWLRSQAQSS